MADEIVRLETERARIDEFLRVQYDSFVPLPIAAAAVFHRAQGDGDAILARRDYDEALNIAAAALSRLVPIYQLRDPREGRLPVPIDLAHQRFARGASELRGNGQPPARDFSIRQTDLTAAISLVKKAGLPFMLAALSSPRPSIDEHQRSGPAGR